MHKAIKTTHKAIKTKGNVTTHTRWCNAHFLFYLQTAQKSHILAEKHMLNIRF